MVVSTGQQLGALYQQIESKGRAVINSDFALEIEGFESHWLLSKQCPWPELSTAGEIERPGPLGMASWEQQQVKTNQQGAVSFFETQAGDIDDLMVNLLVNGGRFNAKIYEGTPERYLSYKPIKNAFLQIDNPDRDWDNRAQILLFSGTMFFHYFGEVVKGGGY